MSKMAVLLFFQFVSLALAVSAAADAPSASACKAPTEEDDAALLQVDKTKAGSAGPVKKINLGSGPLPRPRPRRPQLRLNQNQEPNPDVPHYCEPPDCNPDTNPLLMSQRRPYQFKALSHISHNVPDVYEAAEWYKKTLGFVDAYNMAGPAGEAGYGAGVWPKMGNTPECILCGDICSGMGLPAENGCLADFKWVWHPQFNLYLELIKWYVPEPDCNEAGFMWSNKGWRHIAIEVTNATEVYYRLKDMEGVTVLANKPPGRLPMKVDGVDMGYASFIFFYWKDKYGVYWEMEQGRALGGSPGVTSVGGDLTSELGR